MTLITTYNYEQYSIFDIKEYLESKGYETEFKIVGDGWSDTLVVKGTDIEIDFPKKGEHKKDVREVLLPSICFENSPRTENYEKSKKLYQSLGRKYRKRKDEKLDKSKIKDWEEIQKLIK